MANARSQVIYAHSEEPPQHRETIFLAGTTSNVDATDWRETLSSALSTLPVTIYNPYRPDWDSTWREEADFAPFREQVNWELTKQEEAGVVVVYFHPATQAPVSLLELGISLRVPQKVVVCCPEGYWKRGNVQIVCERYRVKMVEDIEGLRNAIFGKLILSL